MSMHSHRFTSTSSLTAIALAIVLAGTLSCSSAPSGPAQGSPEWYLQAATDNYAIPDFTKTVEQLGEAMKGEGEVAAKATLWHSVLTAGLARGYHELAQAFTDGLEANDARTDEYQNRINDYRRRTKVNAIEFSEGVGAIQKMLQAQPEIAFDFPLPSGNASISPLIESVKAGNKVDAQVAAMEDQTLTRAIFTVTSDMVGDTEPDKLAAAAAAGGVKASSEAMTWGMANILLEVSQMFDREGINDPRVRGFVLDMSERWAEPYYENESFADGVKDYQFDLENERRDIAGKRKIKK